MFLQAHKTSRTMSNVPSVPGCALPAQFEDIKIKLNRAYSWSFEQCIFYISNFHISTVAVRLSKLERFEKQSVLVVRLPKLVVVLVAYFNYSIAVRTCQTHFSYICIQIASKQGRNWLITFPSLCEHTKVALSSLNRKRNPPHSLIWPCEWLIRTPRISLSLKYLLKMQTINRLWICVAIFTTAMITHRISNFEISYSGPHNSNCR